MDLFRWFAGFGIDLAGAWDSRDYHAALTADLAAWVGYNQLLNLHPGVRPTIARRLTALGLGLELDLDAVWPLNAQACATAKTA